MSGSRIQDLLRIQVEAREEVARLAAKLERAKASLRIVEDQMIPEALGEMGIQAPATFKLPDGRSVEIKEQIHASIPEEQRAEVFAALEADGHGDLVKRRVFVQFKAGQDDAPLREEISGLGFRVEREIWVEPSALSGLVRELIEEGEPVPDGVKVFRKKTIKVNQPKERK